MSKFHNMQRNLAFLAAALIPVLLVGILTAGDLNPPAPPTDPTSAMYNLADLYNRLNAGTPGAKRTGAFTEPVAAPGSTMHTLNEIMNKAPAVDALGATADQVLAGKKYWGLNLSQWGAQSGTMSNIGAQQIIPGAATQTINQGYHDGTGAVSGDASLVGANIKSGATIFGVAGNANVVDTSTGNALESQIAAGAKAWVNGQLVTGRLSGGTYVASTTGIWSAGGRWCNRGDGTVVDTYSGLIWDQQGTVSSGSFYTVQALCTDHWRLPTLGELETAVSMWQAPEYVTTNLRTQGIFANITTNWVWTSTRIIYPSAPHLVAYQTVKLDTHDGGGVYPNLNNTMPQLATYTGIFVWRVRSAW
ncbi:MAG: hypothetical protein CVV42_07795 [Candidatus Riflebacteria bacterium HGW-Riflebacteria-2]|nr:MAG: hypothetical protein CVV42_07795 [Candidatus Riflebacteria bacterium HGW-Riflebacteria-2]